jgi:hypothetical protein
MKEYVTVIKNKEGVQYIIYTEEAETNIVKNCHLLYRENIEPLFSFSKNGFDEKMIDYSRLEEKLITDELRNVLIEISVTRIPFNFNSDNITYKMKKMLSIAEEETKCKWKRIKIL